MTLLGLVGVIGGTAHFLSAGTTTETRCRAREHRPPMAPDPSRDHDLEIAAGGRHQTGKGGSYEGWEEDVSGGALDVQWSYAERIELGVALSVATVNELGYERDHSEYHDDHVRTSIAPRVVLDVFRRSHLDFGASLRVRPAWSWNHGRRGDDGSARTMLPLFALAVGTADFWIDVGGGDATALDDNRALHYQVGWRTRYYSALTGIATASTEYDKWSPAWATRVTIPISTRWSFGVDFDLGVHSAIGGWLVHRFDL